MGADLNIILPEIFLSIFAMAGLLVGAYGGKDKWAPLFVWVTSAVLIAVAAWIGFQGAGTARACADNLLNFLKNRRILRPRCGVWRTGWSPGPP